MKLKRRVLWIEDAARYDLVQLVAPVITDGNYDLTIAENASEAIARINQREFDVIIVDIRIPPGDSDDWIELYESSGKGKVAARLGRHLLYTILGHPNAEIKLDNRPVWIKPKRIGVFTVESRLELADDLGQLGILVYRQKYADTNETILLDLIKQILDLQA